MKKTEKITELVELTKRWFIDRHIEEGDVDKQTVKLFEEAGFGEVFNSTLFEVKEAEEW